MKKLYLYTFFFFLLPFSVSFSPGGKQLNSNIHAEYFSPETIHFISYSKNWDEEKLKKLYNELLLNQHGEEIFHLKKVVVHPNQEDFNTLAVYKQEKQEIHLYHGEEFQTPMDYRYILSHEYGHHVQEYYFPEIDYGENSMWYKLRGLNGFPAVEGFASDKKRDHKWYLNEIFANDYVLLFGPKTKHNKSLFEDNSLFSSRFEHENQHIPNIFEQKELQGFLQERTGFSLDIERELFRIQPLKIKDKTLDVFGRPLNRTYLLLNFEHNDRFNISRVYKFYVENPIGVYVQSIDRFEIIPTDFTLSPYHEELEISLRQYNNLFRSEPLPKGILVLQYNTFDRFTNFSIWSEPIYIEVKNKEFHLLEKDKHPFLHQKLFTQNDVVNFHHSLLSIKPTNIKN